jgi:hypothetical protein
MQYDVHIFAVVRVKVCGVEAKSQVDAIKKAEADVNLSEAFLNTPLRSSHPVETEFAEEIQSFLVDVVGDDDYSETCAFDGQYKSIDG